MQKPRITIVTVCYNAEKEIEATLQSVVNLTYPNKEYIIIDGGSKDGTLDTINKYRNSVDICISEKDNGIYDAMNKGIDKASGEWICFMNAGDEFYSNDVIQRVFKLDRSKSDVIYGDTYILNGDKSIIQKAFSLNEMRRFLPFCHQSSFVKVNLIKESPFDLKYRICADYNLFYHIWKNEGVFEYIPEPLSKYDLTGVGYSARNVNSFYYERCLVSSRNTLTAKIKYYFLKIKINLKSILQF